MWIKRKKSGVLMSLGLMMALAACGGPTGTNNDAAKDTLKIGLSQLPVTLDPGRASFRQQFSILQLTAGTLTRLDRDGKSIKSGLAEIEPGDKQYVFKLKSGLKFSDGSPLTSRDVVASFNYYIANTKSIYSYYYAAIEKVTAVDDLTVKFDLKRPDSSLPHILAQPTSAIIPAQAIESKGADLYKDPLPSAGQFTVQTLGQNQITLQANENYIGERPSTKTLVFEKITDAASRLAQVRGGQIDYADDIAPKSLGQISPPLQSSSTGAINGSQFLVMNSREVSTLSDVRIRQAISLAVEREQVSQVAWVGQVNPSLGLLPSASPYHSPFVQKNADPERAKKNLAGTKCENGCTLRLIVASDNEPKRDAAVVLQQNLKAVGIEVNIQINDKSTNEKYANEGNFDLLLAGTYDADPAYYLTYLLGQGSAVFYSGYSNPELDRRLEELQSASETERSAAFDRINDLVAKDMPLTPLSEFSISSVSRVPSDLFTADPGFFFHVG